jgi:hypothetical protein
VLQSVRNSDFEIAQTHVNPVSVTGEKSATAERVWAPEQTPGIGDTT